jgi:hypothetical protein
MSTGKAYLYFWGAIVSGALMVVMFTYTYAIEPVYDRMAKWWNTPKATPTYTSTPATASNMNAAPRSYYPPSTGSTTTVKAPNCGKIIKQLRAGKSVALPAECENSYKASQEAELARQQQKNENEAAQQRELDRQSAERQNQQRLDAEQQARNEQQYREDQQRRDYQARQERENQQREERRREEKAEADRQQARRDAERREQDRQRQQRERNDAIIRLGNDIKKIWKKP